MDVHWTNKVNNGTNFMHPCKTYSNSTDGSLALCVTFSVIAYYRPEKLVGNLCEGTGDLSIDYRPT